MNMSAIGHHMKTFDFHWLCIYCQPLHDLKGTLERAFNKIAWNHFYGTEDQIPGTVPSSLQQAVVEAEEPFQSTW
jgi:hypothetical protein